MLKDELEVALTGNLGAVIIYGQVTPVLTTRQKVVAKLFQRDGARALLTNEELFQLLSQFRLAQWRYRRALAGLDGARVDGGVLVTSNYVVPSGVHGVEKRLKTRSIDLYGWDRPPENCTELVLIAKEYQYSM